MMEILLNVCASFTCSANSEASGCITMKKKLQVIIKHNLFEKTHYVSH